MHSYIPSLALTIVVAISVVVVAVVVAGSFSRFLFDMPELALKSPSCSSASHRPALLQVAVLLSCKSLQGEERTGDEGGRGGEVRSADKCRQRQPTQQEWEKRLERRGEERRGGEGRGEGQWSPLGRGRKGWALREKRLVYWLVYMGKDEVVRCIPDSGKARMRLGKAGEGWGKAG